MLIGDYATSFLQYPMKAKTAKKKYQPQILNIFTYRGFKIREVLNKKTSRREFKCRFQFNNKEFYLTDERRKNLESIIDETLAQERRAKYELPTVKYFPSAEELFKIHLEELKKEGNRKKINRFERVKNQFIKLLPTGIKINEIKKGHFKPFIDERLSEINPRSNEPILPETVNKDLSSLSVAFKEIAYYFPDLEDERFTEVPKLKIKTERRRERLVEKISELDILLEFLRRPHRNQTTFLARSRIADELEIKYETGMRRSEVAALKKSQFKRDEKALRIIKRTKTGNTTKFFPLSERGCEIIESRMVNGSSFIFSANGKPNESDYKTLKKICAQLDIPYGQFTEGGFVPHDLRHNFSTEISRLTDIETAKQLTGHTGTHILTYLHTDEGRMREAVRRREGREMRDDLTELYNQIKDGRITLSAFLEKAESLIKNG